MGRCNCDRCGKEYAVYFCRDCDKNYFEWISDLIKSHAPTAVSSIEFKSVKLARPLDGQRVLAVQDFGVSEAFYRDGAFVLSHDMTTKLPDVTSWAPWPTKEAGIIEAQPKEDEDLFYLQDTRQYVGNSILWWRKGNNGYTTKLDEAQKFRLSELKSLRETDIPWACSEIDRVASQQVDVQDVQCYLRKVSQ